MEIARITLSCREMVALVTAYVEDAMPEEQRVRFEQHVAMCRGCERYLAQMRETIRVTGTLREVDLPPAALDPLQGAFRRWKERRGPGAKP